MSIKVAFIGAGSLGFTRKLMQDVLSVPELQDTCFAFTDINKRNLEMVTELCEKDILENALAAKIVSTTDRREALMGADYVINCSRIGGLEAFQTDIKIPLKYGIDQCVGDTLCAGGIMYGQRNIPCILKFCEDMREVSKPDVLFLNYANPNAMNTWAAIDYGNINTVGLCHGVQHGHEQIAEVLGAGSKDEVDIICAGINHQTWYIQIKYRNKLITAEHLLKAFENHPVYSKTEKVRLDILKRFGYYSTESNGHLSEYLPWYRKNRRKIKKWIDMRNWIHGETGGYLRACTEKRDWFKTDFPRWLKEESPKICSENRSNEHASYIIEALETGRVYRGHFNVKNNNCISNLPSDCIVEVPCYVDKNGMSTPHIGQLPLACAATLNASVSVQRMSVVAAVEGDEVLLKQAMLHDPLTAAVCGTEDVWRLTDEMLLAGAKWLPQYKSAIRRIKKDIKANHS